MPRPTACLLAFIAALMAFIAPLRALELARVTFAAAGDAGTPITGYYAAAARTQTQRAKVPAVIALHGCGGLFSSSHPDQLSARHADWAARWTATGYAVLMPDSFGSRGLADLCRTTARGITPKVRALDAFGAAAWLARQPDIDPGRIALVGWSNGGSTAVWADDARGKPAVDLRTIIAFYPGCRPIERDRGWKPRVPLTILIGAADDWTPAAPCQSLAERFGFAIVQYPDAYHDFDAPSARLRLRKGLAFTGSGDGTAHVGTNPAARAAAITEVTRILNEAFK